MTVAAVFPDRLGAMESTNRVWQKHLRAKGIVPFFLDRLQQHALSSGWQYARGPFHFPIAEREVEDELSRAYFDYVEGFPYGFCRILSPFSRIAVRRGCEIP